MVVQVVKFLTGLLMEIIFCICTTVMSTQFTGNNSCGQLVALTNNIVEGQYMSLQFTTNPGQNITWQKEDASHYIDVKRSEVYNMRSFDEGKVHMLYFWGASSRYNNSGNYRVKCFETFSSPVYVNIGKAPPVEKIYTPSKPEDETTQLETSTHMEDTGGIKCGTHEMYKHGVSIGVGIGISVGIVVIIIVITLFLMRSKIKKRTHTPKQRQNPISAVAYKLQVPVMKAVLQIQDM